MASASKDVLVLNRNWCVVGVVPIPKAMNLLFTNYENGEPKARIITPPPKGSYEVWNWRDWSSMKPNISEEVLVGVSRSYKVPEVVILSRYESLPVRRIHFCRRELWKRDNFTCQYCGIKPPEDECTIDHVIPKSLGGETNWTNCVLACYKCNSQKANRKPEEARKPKEKTKARKWKGPSPMSLIKTPYKPEYSIIRSRGKKMILDSWKHWFDKIYWEIPLDNDMKDSDQ